MLMGLISSIKIDELNESSVDEREESESDEIRTTSSIDIGRFNQLANLKPQGIFHNLIVSPTLEMSVS